MTEGPLPIHDLEHFPQQEIAVRHQYRYIPQVWLAALLQLGESGEEGGVLQLVHSHFQ